MFAPLLCVTILAWPVASQASASKDAQAHFHTTCDNALRTAKEGDLTLGTCTQGKIALGVHKNQKTASVVYGVMAGVAAGMIVAEASGLGAPAAQAVCIGLGLGGVAKNLVDSQKLKEAGKDVIGAYASAVNSAVKMGAGMLITRSFTKAISQSVMESVKLVTEATPKAAKGSCAITAIGLGVMMSGSVAAAVTSRKVLEKATTTAGTQIEGSKNSASFNLANKNLPNNNVAAPNNNPAVTMSCSNESGDGVLKCLGKTNPEIAALVSDPKAMDSLNKALDGKNLGDLAKNYDGDSEQDLANYVGSALGASSSAMAEIMGATKKAAQAIGNQEAYKPGTFASAGGSAGGANGGADPMEKMLADMMKQMGDPGEEGLGKDRDPASEISFGNQMELLTPEQVASRKDISLFDRAHYRMQKNVKNLEQLNWTARDH